jgi:hypothetical protein
LNTELSAIAVRKALAAQRMNGLEVSSPASRTESEEPVKQAPEKISAKYARSKSTDQSARSFAQVSPTSIEQNGQRDDLEGSIPRFVILYLAAHKINYAFKSKYTDFQ